MLSKDEVIEDLNDVCNQTKARWLCYDDIHTIDFKKDAELFISEMARLGYSKRDLLLLHKIELSYTGGAEIVHEQEACGSGYTIRSKKNKNQLVVLSGFETDFDKYTIYHECGHLYQFKYNMFNINHQNEYNTYLVETHANTFATMVMLLKADNVLEYKKRKLYRMANGVSFANDERKELIYYVSLPIELALMREIRKKGRLKTKEEFSKHGILDYKKIAFYTAQLVKKHCFSQEEFEKIKNKEITSKYEKLKRKAKAYRILGETYWNYIKSKCLRRIKRHNKINQKREHLVIEKIQPLPQTDKETEIINAACLLDTYQIRMIYEYDIWEAIGKLKKADETLNIPDEIKSDSKKINEAEETFKKMHRIYQKHKDNKLFQELFEKIEFIDTRDEVWQLKEKKAKEIERQNFRFGLSNER